MVDLSLGDATQRAVLIELATTERLLTTCASSVSDGPREASIIALPDLGVARGVGRMVGGFFNGALYAWEDAPIVPIDATVNSCGVSVFRLRRRIKSRAAFDEAVHAATRRVSDTCYSWNFAEGNHFISYAETETALGPLPAGAYLVLHSSAAEFKRQYNGLYPSRGNWYESSVGSVQDTTTGRSLRFVSGEIADRFVEIATMLPVFNRVRHRMIAHAIAGDDAIAEESMHLPHYGMPSSNSIAVGCQWLEIGQAYVFLTTPYAPFYVIEASQPAGNRIEIDGVERALAPHGLGNVVRGNAALWLSRDALHVDGRQFSREDTLAFGQDIVVRGTEEASNDGVRDFVAEMLTRCPGVVHGELPQLYNHSRATRGSGPERRDEA